MGISSELLQELKVGFLYSLTLYYFCVEIQRNLKSPNHRNTCTTTCIAVLFAIDYLWNPPRYPSTHEERNHGMYIQWNFNLTVKNKVMPLARRWTDLDIITLNKISQTPPPKKKRCSWYVLTCSFPLCLLCHFALYLYKKEFVWLFFSPVPTG